MAGSSAHDIRYAFRVLAKSPAVTSVALISLALGIGANTAIFSLINAVILRSLPVARPGELVALGTVTADSGNGEQGFSLPMLEEIAKRQQVFSSMFSYTGLGGMNNFEANGVRFAEALNQVDGTYYSTLEVRPFLGRVIEPSDVALNAGSSDQVAVLTYRCWQLRYQGDPSVLGKTIRIDGLPFTIVGVSSKGFDGIVIDGSSEVTVPLATRGQIVFRGRNQLWLHLMGRLKPGVKLDEARAQLTALWPRIQEVTVPEEYDSARRARFFARRISVTSAATGLSYLRENFSRPLVLLMGLVALVLLIACVNLANLMVARAAGRRQEMGIRVALGADTWQLTRQLLTESAMLSFLGAILGVLLATWASRLLIKLLWTGFTPLALDPAPDLRVLLFTAAVATATGILFGLAPVVRVVKTDPATVLREASRTVRGGGGLVRRVLVSAQVALSFVLVIGALLFVQSLQNLRNKDLGFNTNHLLTMQLIQAPGATKISNRAAYYRQLGDELSRLPGVEAISYSYGAPTSRYEQIEAVSATGSPGAPLQSVVDFVGPGFFQMIGTRILAGREFGWEEDATRARVAIISESLARRLFPDENPIGRKINVGPLVAHRDMEVVGVVNSASLWKPQSQNPLAAYIPLLQEAEYNNPLVILRTAQNPQDLKAGAQRVVESLGRHYPLRIQTWEERAEMFLTEQRITAMLSGFFGTLAILLAAIGIYGLMSYAVTGRTSEIGVRMALGAQSASVLALVLREVLWLSLGGILAGIPIALAASRLISGMLFGLSPGDPSTIAAAIIALVTVAGIAGYLPARRASRIEPMIALRAE